MSNQILTSPNWKTRFFFHKDCTYFMCEQLLMKHVFNIKLFLLPSRHSSENDWRISYNVWVNRTHSKCYSEYAAKPIKFVPKTLKTGIYTTGKVGFLISETVLIHKVKWVSLTKNYMQIRFHSHNRYREKSDHQNVISFAPHVANTSRFIQQ